MSFVGKRYGEKNSHSLRGSVNSEKCRKFLKDGQMDGLLVGSKSLNKEEFKKILESE